MTYVRSKINVDGAFYSDAKTEGWGAVIRDSSEDVLAAGAGVSAMQRQRCKLKQLLLTRVSSLQHSWA